MVTYGDVSSGKKFIYFFDNLSLTTGIFLVFIKHETILRAGFPKANRVHLSYKKMHFQSF
jgi:hypothetical protein